MDCVASQQYDISSVDFHDVDNVNDFAYQLVEAGNSAGIFLNVKPLQSSAAVKVYQTAKAWVNAVKRRLTSYQATDCRSASALATFRLIARRFIAAES